MQMFMTCIYSYILIIYGKFNFFMIFKLFIQSKLLKSIDYFKITRMEKVSMKNPTISVLINNQRFMQNKQIKEERYRFVVFAVYILAAIAASLPINTFSALNSIVEKTYNLSIVQVSLNTLFFPSAHTLFAFPCNWIINKKGMRFGFFLSGIFLISGVWLRTFLSVGNPYICLLGSFLSAIGGIFILNTPSRIALNWFRSQRVPVITFIGVLTNIVSMAISLSIPGFFINTSSSSDDIINFLRAQAAFVTVPLILLMVFSKDKPANPPSKAAHAMNTEMKKNYLDIVKYLFTNFEYVKLCVAMALNFGISISFLAVIDQILVGIGHKTPGKVISICGSSAIVFGIFANLLYSYTIRRTKLFKKIIVMVTVGEFIGLFLLSCGLLQLASEWWELVILSSIFCFSHFSIPSIYVLYSTQVAFPIDQASSAGYLMAISQAVGFLIGLLYASLLDGSKTMAQVLIYTTVGLVFMSFLITLTMKQDLRKSRYEETNELDGKTAESSECKESLLSNV